MSQTWETLVAVALLGTDRQGTLPTIAEKKIKPVLDQLNIRKIWKAGFWVLLERLWPIGRRDKKLYKESKYPIDPL